MLALGLVLAGCRGQETAPAAPSTGSPATASERSTHAPQSAPPKLQPEPRRVVAIGDLHGDLAAARGALDLAGVIDDEGKWRGGATVLVQTGDILDRGNDEPELLELFERLTAEAEAAGGAVVALNGNHELMNVAGDMRYITREGAADFAPLGASGDDAVQARVAAFAPGAAQAMRLAKRDVVAVVGDTVFVHGGLLSKHVQVGVDTINRSARAWMQGNAELPEVLAGDDAPVWVRLYGGPAPDCTALEDTLEALGARRMVVGHTVQEHGITSACEQQVWRIDVGLSAHYGGTPQVLEIVGDDVRVIGQ